MAEITDLMMAARNTTVGAKSDSYMGASGQRGPPLTWTATSQLWRNDAVLQWYSFGKRKSVELRLGYPWNTPSRGLVSAG